MKQIWVVGRGLVAQMMSKELFAWAEGRWTVALVNRPELIISIGTRCELVVLCGVDSTDMIGKIDPSVPVLDMSPTFRGHVDWVYGMLDVHMSRTRGWSKLRVANPGCMATAAILMLEPLVELCMIDIRAAYYLDTVVGYSAGGIKMIEKYEDVDPPSEQVSSLANVHPHVPEIKYATGITGDVVLTPKVGNFYSGIRMQVLIPNAKREELLDAYEYIYNRTGICVDRSVPNKIAGDDWASKKGARINVFQHGSSCLVVCVMDNLRLGAVDNAVANINWMLGTK